MAEINGVSRAMAGSPAVQSQKGASPQSAPKAAALQPKADVVSISAQGKAAVQQTAQHTPAQKASVTQAGKK